MSRGRVQHRALHNGQIGIHDVRGHLGQPLHQRLRPQQIRGVDPPLHREAAVGAHVQRGRGRHLDIGVGAREPIDITVVLKLERLPHHARRIIKLSHQPAVVPVVFRVGTVRGIALAAPPAGDARPAIGESHLILAPQRKRQRARDRAQAQRQVIRTPGRRPHIRHHTHQVIGHPHRVGNQHERAVRFHRRHRDQIGRHLPAAKQVINAVRPPIIAVGGPFKIGEQIIRPQIQRAEAAGIFDGHRGQVGVIRESQVGCFFLHHHRRISPFRRIGHRPAARTIHHNEQVGGRARAIRNGKGAGPGR